MEQSQIEERLDRISAKLDATYVSAEKTRKYFLYTIIITVVTFVVPLLLLLAALPMFINSYGSLMNI